jgi:hypothetical protein
MTCERCDQGHRHPVRTAKLAERQGRVAVVLSVPMEECVACRDRWFDWHVARRLDGLLNQILATDVEVATRHYDESLSPSA